MRQPSAIVQEWWERAEHDMLTARIAVRGNAPTDTVLMLLQQGAEKYLKGYLLGKGWRLKKTHDLRLLLDEAIEYDRSFEAFKELGRILTGHYVEYRYPAGALLMYDVDETAGLLQQTEELIEKVKTSI